MRIVITGGAGFIGSHLCEFLLQKDHEVICVDNLITGRKENLSAIMKNKNFTFIEHDVTQPMFFDEKIDWIFHMASPASPVDYQIHPIHTLKVGSLGTYTMLGVAKKYKSRFLLASTSEVYGDPEIHPQNEEYWGHVNTIGPRGVYDEAKRFAEAITMAYHRVHGLETRIARIFNTFGPRMRLNDGRAVPNFIDQALQNQPLTIYGDGSQTRSFCYITDQIDGLYRLMSSEYAQPVNIGNPEELTILEFAKLIKKLCNSKSSITFHPLPTDDPKQRKPDISRAKEVLGWEPKVPLRVGLEKTIDYFKDIRKKGIEKP
jgi:dTDP-glucose 4,6-dehydratase